MEYLDGMFRMQSVVVPGGMSRSGLFVPNFPSCGFGGCIGRLGVPCCAEVGGGGAEAASNAYHHPMLVISTPSSIMEDGS
mmetsp:Transcript_23837/g.55598  ORF Transcript_23837/g.55598 Transcript_23837/m.55598 type:complete len:80 (+) Transcript_23837:532-771(+)